MTFRQRCANSFSSHERVSRQQSSGLNLGNVTAEVFCCSAGYWVPAKLASKVHESHYVLVEFELAGRRARKRMLINSPDLRLQHGRSASTAVTPTANLCLEQPDRGALQMSNTSILSESSLEEVDPECLGGDRSPSTASNASSCNIERLSGKVAEHDTDVIPASGEKHFPNHFSNFIRKMTTGSCEVAPPKGYEKYSRNGEDVFTHVKSGIVVRQKPVVPSTNQCGNLGSHDAYVVLYHYTNEIGFDGICASKQMWATLLENAENKQDKDTCFGDGTYATEKAPCAFGSKRAVLVNNLTDKTDKAAQDEQIAKYQGLADFCIPVIVPREQAFNVMRRSTPMMPRPGVNRYNEEIRKDRDIWVIAPSDQKGDCNIYDSGTWVAGLNKEEAFSVVRKLKDIGLDADVDLPQICVVGKQSSGKSSVLEALAAIKVPRAAGVCTRCAFEISSRQENGQPFHCQVSIRCEEKSKLQLCSTDQKEEVCSMLKTAQLILVNMGDIDMEHMIKGFLSEVGPDGQLTRENVARLEEKARSLGERFYQGAVVVELRGEECPLLELVDLPGLIQYGRDQQLIRKMCKNYVEKTSTIIAMCCPCDDDLENQEVRGLAEKHDSRGIRTVGILTKADLLQPTSEDRWVEKLKYSDDFIKYFAVRNPTPEELNQHISREKARNAEMAFFHSNNIGKKLHEAAPDQCGVEHLSNHLGEKLSVCIRGRLPRLQQDFTSQLVQAEEELEDIGPEVETKNLRFKLLAIIDQWVQEFEKEIKDGDSFNKHIRAIHERFERSCQLAMPKFRIGDIVLPDHAEISDGEVMPEAMTLQQVKVKMDEARIKELDFPGGLSPATYRAAMQMSGEARAHWRTPSNLCIKEASSHVRKLMRTVLEGGEKMVFKNKYPEFVEKSKTKLEAFIDGLETDVRKSKHRLLEKQETNPHTSNKAELDTRFWNAQWQIVQHVQGAPLQRCIQKLSSRIPSKEDLRAEMEIIMQNSHITMMDSKDAGAIWCMAATLAYSSLAFNRYCDNLEQSINSDLLTPFWEQSKRELVSSLELHEAADDILMHRFPEDPNQAARRKSLADKVQRLQKGIRVLEEAELGKPRVLAHSVQ